MKCSCIKMFEKKFQISDFMSLFVMYICCMCMYVYDYIYICMKKIIYFSINLIILSSNLSWCWLHDTLEIRVKENVNVKWIWNIFGWISHIFNLMVAILLTEFHAELITSLFYHINRGIKCILKGEQS